MVTPCVAKSVNATVLDTVGHKDLEASRPPWGQ